MLEFLQELVQFLEQNNLNNFIISIIISITGCIIAILRTRASSIKKKAGYVNLAQFKIEDYVILYNGKILSFKQVVIKKKTDLSKIDLEKYKDEGGLLDAT